MTRNNITKSDISKNLNRKIGISLNSSKKLIDDLVFILSELIKYKKIFLKNIGTFKLIQKNERLGRNPKTKESFIITKRKTVNFTASKSLINLINK